MIAGIAIATLLSGCKRPPPLPSTEPDPQHFEQRERLEGVTTMTADAAGQIWVALGNDFARRPTPDATFEFVSRGDLPPGHITFLGSLSGTRDWLFAHVHGQGVYRTWTNSGAWQPVLGLQSPQLEVLSPGLRPIPTGMASASDGVHWLSAIGGLYYTSDEGVTWDRADTSSSGDANIVFTDVDALDGRVAAVSLLPEGLIPAQFAGILSGRVFLSDNSGLTWRTPDDAFPSNHPTSVALGSDGYVYVGTMDQGVVRGDDQGNWVPLFGPSDVTDVEWTQSGLSVASASRGLWRLDDEIWSAVGSGPAIGVENNLGVLRNGEVYELEDGPGETPPLPRNGQVSIALSFYVNYYHSTRGDGPQEDGFGQDIRVITRILNWLDADPELRADWVFENARTTSDRMPTYSPELLTRIRERLANGADDVRLANWSGAPMAALTPSEFSTAMNLAKEATTTDLAASWVPGVHPQSNIVSPGDLGRYADEGISWMTLFYGANGFTALRNEVELNGAAAHNPIRLSDPATGRSLTVMPVYHHGDLLDHGGLEGWVKQLNANHDEDTLLVLHFDADAESWENFDRELEGLRDLPFVQFTTLNDYIGTHAPLQDFPLLGDLAGGANDGFSSWGEKTINREVWSKLERSRHLTAAAQLLAPTDTATNAAIRAAELARLEGLAANNFGLTTPNLHPERAATARVQAQEALDLAEDALALSGIAEPLEPAVYDVINPFNITNRTTVHMRIGMPLNAWEGEGGLEIRRGPRLPPPALQPLVPIRAKFVGQLGGRDIIDVEADVVVTPFSRTVLAWSYDPGEINHVRGSLTPSDIPTLPLLQAPFIECTSGRRVATGGQVGSTVGPWGLRNSRREEWQLPSCQGSSSTILRTLTNRHDFPGVIVEVEGTINQAADAGGLLSLALTPLTCPSGIRSVTWPSYSGVVRTREVPQREAWNPVAANGWVEATCNDGSVMQIAFDQGQSSTMAPLSLRNLDDEGTLAPMGTLWGDPPWHDGQRNNGTGLADLITPLIGSQFNPSAPEWAGKNVKYRIWVTQNTDTDMLDLFAKPPVVRTAL